MARKSSSKPEILVVASITTPTLIGNQLYVPEPPLQEEKSLICKSQVLIPFIIAEITHAFSDPFSDVNTNVARINEFFPCYHRTKPLGAMKEPLAVALRLYEFLNNYREDGEVEAVKATGTEGYAPDGKQATDGLNKNVSIGISVKGKQDANVEPMATEGATSGYVERWLRITRDGNEQKLRETGERKANYRRCGTVYNRELAEAFERIPYDQGWDQHGGNPNMYSFDKRGAPRRPDNPHPRV
ncbi:hypothetical protein KIW84_075101 [Lathyrus oleraceus]|uniref:Uncharacterized protein n=1 Tax=Pisum sativum TaxID=3888 RepID=A0A9D4VUH0_PEA|nr:hypothetical protein KIW84_075101 [Pisum sativum]